MIGLGNIGGVPNHDAEYVLDAAILKQTHNALSQIEKLRTGHLINKEKTEKVMIQSRVQLGVAKGAYIRAKNEACRSNEADRSAAIDRVTQCFGIFTLNKCIFIKKLLANVAKAEDELKKQTLNAMQKIYDLGQTFDRERNRVWKQSNELIENSFKMMKKE